MLPFVKTANSSGFTLIELLVVMTIVAILGVGAFVNFKDFTQNQTLKKSLSQVQSLLRLAQANSTANVLCQTQSGVDWTVYFKTDKVNIDLICGPSHTLIKTAVLEGVQVNSVKGSACSSETSLPLQVTYSKLPHKVNFDSVDGNSDACLERSSSVLVNFKNLKTQEVKGFTISKGGAIDAQ